MDQGEQQLDRSNRLQQDFQNRMMELLQASIGARFSEVASSSEALGEEIPALTESSKKLAAELEGIMASIPEIDPASHSNAEVSESAMVATEELDGQAKELRCMVANGRVKGRTGRIRKGHWHFTLPMQKLPCIDRIPRALINAGTSGTRLDSRFAQSHFTVI